jgi:hypothetical protein
MSDAVTIAVIGAVGTLVTTLITQFRDEIKQLFKKSPSQAPSNMSASSAKAAKGLSKVKASQGLSGNSTALSHNEYRSRPFDTEIKIEETDGGKKIVFNLPQIKPKREWGSIIFWG